MLHYVIIGLLLLIVAGERMNFVAHRKMAEHNNMPWPGAKQLFTDGCPWFSPSVPPPAMTPTAIGVPTQSAAPPPVAMSGFANDFMAHARVMDARRQGVPNSPAKKMEGIMTSNDHAQRKLRSKLIGSGLGR
jgi:hypothetical protein